MPHYGFNFLWMYVWDAEYSKPQPVDEKALDFLALTGFNFVRLPTDYRFWVRDFDYQNINEEALIPIDNYLAACRERKLHFSLNIHRAPGYCINYNYLERDNLWTDPVAQDGFVHSWETFARRYKGISGEELSFDLLNEPPSIDQYGLTRENHAALIRRTVAAIRAIDPQRKIVIDGLGGGNIAMPELADLNVTQSGRGYQPMPVSHHQATWWDGHETAPAPQYPGLEWRGHTWNREKLFEFYTPWRELQQQGVEVHIGEMGCYNKTPNDIALRWFADLFDVYRELGWGFALWNFIGSFGIIDHGRPGARYEELHGYKVDRDLLDLIDRSRLSAKTAS
jgi:endoglucanase